MVSFNPEKLEVQIDKDKKMFGLEFSEDDLSLKPSPLDLSKTIPQWPEKHIEHWLQKLEITPNTPEYLYQIALIHDRDNNEYRPKSHCLDDNIEALKWYEKALQAGSDKAQERIDFLQNWMKNQKDFAGFDYSEDCDGKTMNIGQEWRNRLYESTGKLKEYNLKTSDRSL